VSEIPEHLPEPVEVMCDNIFTIYTSPEGQVTLHFIGGGMAVYTPEGFSDGDPAYERFEGKLAYRWDDGTYVPDG
jgi:hypothetical protein